MCFVILVDLHAMRAFSQTSTKSFRKLFAMFDRVDWWLKRAAIDLSIEIYYAHLILPIIFQPSVQIN